MFCLSRSDRRNTKIIKRGMDLIGALLGLIFCAPLMLVIACIIALDSPGPILFVQERAGKGGKPFKMYKFRTMAPNAEERPDWILDNDGFDDLSVPKIKDDPRVTRVGRWLRRYSLDELPQFFNVLKGEMSLVGPRPEDVRVVMRYKEWYYERLTVKPGLTGPMQVGGRGDLSFSERFRLEIDYIENYSLWMDIKILLKTIPVVLQGKGAY